MGLMQSQNIELNRLMPYGYVATRQYLLGKGVEVHRLAYLVKARRLEALAPGVYHRPDDSLKWQGVVSALQLMGYNAVVGGLTALEQNGFGHYLALSTNKTIHLYGDPLPTWINNLGLPETFVGHGTKRLFEPTMAGDAYTSVISWAEGLWRANVSTPERAVMEMLEDVPEGVSFEHADQLMQGLTTLSPRRLDTLLREVRSVKVKRLFFWLADRQQYPWLGKLKASDYDLGSGKRVLVKGGRLDRTYQITVPPEFHGQE